jgi:hypothetical protein
MLMARSSSPNRGDRVLRQASDRYAVTPRGLHAIPCRQQRPIIAMPGDFDHVIGNENPPHTTLKIGLCLSPNCRLLLQ